MTRLHQIAAALNELACAQTNRDTTEQLEGFAQELNAMAAEPTTEAKLAVALERMTAFCDALAPAESICSAIRNAGLGRQWDEFMDAVRELPRASITVWEVQNQTDGCGGCTAGGYEECLISPIDARVDLMTSGVAPDDCPLRRGKGVLLVGEPGS